MKTKQTTIGEIPADWEVVRLDDSIEIQTGKRAKGGALTEGEILSLGGEHIGVNGKIIWGLNSKYIPEKFYDKLTQGKIKLGDILLVKDGATTGKTAFVDNMLNKKVAVNEHVFIIRVKEKGKFYSRFLFYVLFSKIGQRQIKQTFHGMIGGIKKSNVKSLKIPLPPLHEQKAIAEVLSTVDKAIEKSDQIIQKTERFKKGLMQGLLTRGIGHTEFKDTEIGRIPKEWEIKKFEKVCIKIQSGGTPLTSKKEFYVGDIPFVKIEDISAAKKYIIQTQQHISKKGLENSTAWVIPPRSLLLAIYGSLGKVAINKIPLATNQAILGIILNNKLVNTEFVYYLIKNMNLKKYAKQSTQANLTAKIIKNLKIVLLPLHEQKKIAEILSTVDEKLELERKRKEKLERIKKGLMNDLLTGRKRVLLNDKG